MQASHKQKIIVVISRIDYALGFDWLDQYMDKSRYELQFVFLNDTEPTLHTLFLQRRVKSVYLPYSSRKDLPRVMLALFQLFRREKPHWVHAHLFDACLAALPAARFAGVKGRVYTRHHSTIHHVYHPHMVKIDKLLNALSTDIIAISDNVKSVLTEKEGVRPEKIRIIHHGFDLEKFIHRDPLLVDGLHKKYNPSNRRPVIGVISRFTHWKGLQYTIPAFQSLLHDFPEALLLLANAKGDFESGLRPLIAQLPEGSCMEIPFEKDLFSLYGLFDIFVHVPVDESAEAYGQIYVEALAAGIPSVFTLSGIAREFIHNEQNALVVPFCNQEAIYEACKRLLTDDTLRIRLIDQGRADVCRLFPVERMIAELSALYISRNQD